MSLSLPFFTMGDTMPTATSNSAKPNPGPAVPTVGAVIGGAVGGFIARTMHADPVTEISIVTGCSAVLTAVFHQLGKVLGTSALG